MKKVPWKQLLIIATLGVGVFFLVEIYKVFAAGERSLSNLLTAPFTAAKKVWTSLTGFLSSSASAIGGVDTSNPAAVVASVGVDPNSPLGQMMQTDYSQAAGQALINGTPLSTPSSDNSTVAGIWSSP
jgi:hypothetical protein